MSHATRDDVSLRRICASVGPGTRQETVFCLCQRRRTEFFDGYGASIAEIADPRITSPVTAKNQISMVPSKAGGGNQTSYLPEWHPEAKPPVVTDVVFFSVQPAREEEMKAARTRRRVYTAEFKADVVLEGLSKATSVNELCRLRGISVGLFYEWRNRFICSGTAGLKRRVPPRQTKGSTSTSLSSKRREAAELAAKFQKYRSDQAKFAGRFTVSERQKAIELVESASVPKRLAIRSIGVASSSYYRWCRLLRENGALESYVRAPEYLRISEREDVRQLVFKVLHAPPSDFGFNRTTWRQSDLQLAIEKEGMRIGRHAIRSIIKSAGYRWMNAKKVLTSNDPDYRSKLTRIQDILANLGSNEGFFSIDEYGPFAVKQREGRKLVAPGMTNTVPQFQKSKGALIMTAALELSSNQVTHFYSKKKNTDEMIKLLEVLLDKYDHLDRFFMSWDAASWHVSKKLRDRIEAENSKRSLAGGPVIDLVPLPAGAQFLNVIESIFSGMSRAVIHNSNYSSKEEAIATIDRYFEERNKHFRMNPQRAGKKIWGHERSPSRFSESNNCKDSRYR